MKLSDPLKPGEVALVGAGPGDPDLLTVAARVLLADCDVIVYDALVSEDVLDLGAMSAARIFAGKRGGRPSTSQADICEAVIRLAREGKRVVRLKGGGPFVFALYRFAGFGQLYATPHELNSRCTLVAHGALTRGWRDPSLPAADVSVCRNPG